MEHPATPAHPVPVADAARRFARQLAADSTARGDATGWFERLYAAADQGRATVPWADFTPYPGLVSALAGLPGAGPALVVGSGLGDAEYVAADLLSLLLVARARDERDHPGEMPWPLTRAEVESFHEFGPAPQSIAEVLDDEPGGPVRRWRAWFTAPDQPDPRPNP